MTENRIAGPSYRAIGPGRVNLLGEHVDYNGGVVLPAAIDRQVTITAQRAEGAQITLSALDMGQTVSIALDNLEARVDLSGAPLPVWALYPAGVAWALQQHGLSVAPLQAAFSSDIPIGSGLSSSAAVEVAFAALWRELGGWEMDNMQRAQISQEAEVRYVGVNCGLMDQFASSNGVEGHALYFDTRSLFWRPVPLPPDTALVIADSTMRRSLTSSAYNERRAQCEEAVRLLQRDDPHIQTLRDVTPAQFYAHAGELPEVIRKRARHIVDEIARVEEAMVCLENNDARGFGRLMFDCHVSLRDLYEVSIPELDKLVEIAAQIPGCLGARLTGAGFGGCTVNLVQEEDSSGFIEKLQSGYRQATGRNANVYLCHASQGARAWKISATNP